MTFLGPVHTHTHASKYIHTAKESTYTHYLTIGMQSRAKFFLTWLAPAEGFSDVLPNEKSKCPLKL